MEDTNVCVVCGDDLILSKHFTREQGGSVCYPCVAFSEAKAAMDAGVAIRVRNPYTPKLRLKEKRNPDNGGKPNPLRLVEFKEYESSQKEIALRIKKLLEGGVKDDSEDSKN